MNILNYVLILYEEDYKILIKAKLYKQRERYSTSMARKFHYCKKKSILPSCIC